MHLDKLRLPWLNLTRLFELHIIKLFEPSQFYCRLCICILYAMLHGLTNFNLLKRKSNVIQVSYIQAIKHESNNVSYVLKFDS